MSYVFYRGDDNSRWFGIRYTVDNFGHLMRGPSDCWLMAPPATWECD